MSKKYTLLFIIMILTMNGIFANCIGDIPIYFPFYDKVDCVCYEETKTCNCNITEYIYINFGNLDFLTECNDYNINFYTNGNHIVFKSYFDFSSSDNNINIIANDNSKIIIYENASYLKLPNIIVNSGRTLDIETYGPTQETDKYHIVDIESLFVHPTANLNINLKSNDGKSKGVNKTLCKVEDKDGTNSGNIIFKTVSITNYGNTNISLETGKGGDGVKREREDCGGNFDQSGGNGGDSGNLDFNITSIYNYGELTLDLKTGVGGNGGYSSIDDTKDEYFNGGNGGSTGNIYISNIEQIINYDSLTFNATTGDGGFGGVQRANNLNDHCDKGTNGFGGSSGNISDIKITTLLNKANANFKLNIENGKLGEIDISVGKACISENWTTDYKYNIKGQTQTKCGDIPLTFGAPGKLGDITIDFMENKSINGLEIKSSFAFTEEQYNLAVVATSNGGIDRADNGGNMRQLPDLNLRLSDIKINYLSNGSYLPRKIFANIGVKNYEYFDNNISITGCYINPTKVDYKVNDNTKIVASNPDAVSNLNPYFDMKSRYCPHCEAISLDDTQNRYTRNYSIFSNIRGTINIGDLNIYYSDPSYQLEYYTKRTDNKQLPVYTNKALIEGSLNPKINSYEYKIEPKDLIYYSHTPEDDINYLNQEDYLFCYGQEYILKGKINGDKSFSFPFVPLRELFTD